MLASKKKTANNIVLFGILLFIVSTITPINAYAISLCDVFVPDANNTLIGCSAALNTVAKDQLLISLDSPTDITETSALLKVTIIMDPAATNASTNAPKTQADAQGLVLKGFNPANTPPTVDDENDLGGWDAIYAEELEDSDSGIWLDISTGQNQYGQNALQNISLIGKMLERNASGNQHITGTSPTFYVPITGLTAGTNYFATIRIDEELSTNKIYSNQFPFTTKSVTVPLTTTTTTTTTSTSPVYTLLAPLDGPNPLETFDTSEDNAFGRYLNIMLIILIGISAVLAVIMIVMGGIEYMTSELVSSKEGGKERIRNAIFGLLLALGAFAILNTLNPQLLDVSLSGLPTAQVAGGEDTPQAPQVGSGGGKYYCNNTSYTEGATWSTLAGAPAALPAGVAVAISGGAAITPSGTTPTSVECATVGQSSCTSLRGLDNTLITSVDTACKTHNGGTSCGLIITGGTECWLHSNNTTHKPGSGTIDLRKGSAINAYAITGTKTVGTYVTYTIGGIRFTDEGNHWHVRR